MLLLGMAGCVREPLQPEVEPVAEEAVEPVGEGQGNVVKVLFTDEMAALVEDDLAAGNVRTKSDGLNSLVDACGIASMERLFPYAGEYEPRTRRAGLHRWYKVRFREDVPATKAVDGFLSLPGVEYAAESPQVTLATDDTYWSSLWGLYNSSYAGYDVNVLPVWEGYTVGRPEVVVAVVDGGIQLDHPDLAWNCLATGHQNYVVGGTTIYPHSHGTHVAGTIAAVGNNGTGIAGVAGGDYAAGRRGVSLLSLQCFQSSGNTDRSGDFESAIKDAADKGAVICSNSWGYTFDANENGKVDADELQNYKYYHENTPREFREAVNYFIENAGCDGEGNQRPDSPMKGGVVIFAAGNDNIQYGPPANYEPCIAVGAIAQTGARASFSNYGDWVDICAPGVSIRSTIPTGSYASYNGTSMACPHVSGIAALLVSYFGGPGFTNQDLKDRLLGGAREVAASTGTRPIGPMADAFGAFLYGDGTEPDAVADLTAAPAGNNLVLSFTASEAYGYLAVAGKTEAAVRNADLRNPQGVSTSTLTVTNPALYGTPVTLRIEDLDFETDYYVAVAAFSYNRTFSERSRIVKVRTDVNHPPVVEVPSDALSFHQHENIELPFRVYDPDGHDIEVSFTTDGRARFTQEGGDAYLFTLVCQLAQPKAYSATITATDRYGMKATKSFTYTVLQNHAPEVAVPLENRVLPSAGATAEVDLDAHFTDADDETLSYMVTSLDPAVVSAALDDRRLRITASALGLGHVRVAATDAMGERVTAEMTVLVRPEGEEVSFLMGDKGVLTILPGLEEADTSVRVYGTTGAVVYTAEGRYSAFQPVVADLGKAAPGRYTATVTYAGQTYRKTIIKR